MDKRTILVVDDDDMIRELIALMIADNFSERDVSVAQAKDGVEGLEMAKSLHPVMIITDVMMPNMSGLEVIRQLRADPSTRSMFVITISGTTDSEMALAAGCDQFVHKPFELDELLGAVDHWLPRADAPIPITGETANDRVAMIDERTAANRARIAEIQEHLKKRETEATTRWELIVIVKEHTDARMAQAQRRMKLARDRMVQVRLQDQWNQDQLASTKEPRSSAQV